MCCSLLLLLVFVRFDGSLEAKRRVSRLFRSALVLALVVDILGGCGVAGRQVFDTVGLILCRIERHVEVVFEVVEVGHIDRFVLVGRIVLR